MSIPIILNARHWFAVLGLVVCAACTPLAPEPPTTTPKPVATAAPTPIAAPTATDCPTAWNWATGPGSPAFDEQLSAALVGAGLDVRGVRSTGFGENNLCNGSFHAMSLDVLVEIAVAVTPDEPEASRLNADILQAIEGARAFSTIPNLGRIEVHFIAPDSAWRCVTPDGGEIQTPGVSRCAPMSGESQAERIPS